MSTLTTVATLHATRTGHAEALSTVRHQHVDERPFVLVPLKLAGEACAPLAAMAGTDPERPVLLTVHQPQNRDARFAFCAELAGLLLTHIEACRSATETYTAGRPQEERTRATRAPQILVPTTDAIAYLRLLARSTRLRATEGPHAVDPSVPALGKWLTWATDAAEFPGSSTLLAMTRTLTAHWATGQSPAENANLASLLAWIDPPPGRTGAEAARVAEDPAACPPAGPATDPVFDQQLYDLMTRHRAASSTAARAAAARQIDLELRGQLLPTWQLMWRGIELLRALPAGRHVADRWTLDRTLFTSYADYLDEDGRPQARRDHAVGAARRLARLEEATARYEAERAYDDPLVMAEYELTGEAFSGTVVERDPDRLDTSGRTPRRRPTITLRTREPVRLAVGDLVRCPARPSQKAVIVSLDAEHRAVLVEITGGLGQGYKKPLPAGTVPELDEQLTFSTLDPRGMLTPLPAEEDTPWTHGGPPAPYEPTDEDAEEIWE
ncbi:hypothetical protein [Streptomyces sp. MZ04]|uniref:hypothetical protein n=1 Tax=Streptomyces sp. MZ04 TaxID=2559236 RepID=UPI00107EE461|nr:hypothetical protein [Streptomyces sp. MZ04]TGB13583.1 hypothetical protein E2651_08930 [Streptomyces sp. MZ04]